MEKTVNMEECFNCGVRFRRVASNGYNITTLTSTKFGESPKIYWILMRFKDFCSKKCCQKFYNFINSNEGQKVLESMIHRRYEEKGLIDGGFMDDETVKPYKEAYLKDRERLGFPTCEFDRGGEVTGENQVGSGGQGGEE